MKISLPGGARAAHYDRNQTNPSFSATVNAAAPHGSTARASYTVPAARKAFLTIIQLTLDRVTVAAPVGKYQAWWAFAVNGLAFNFSRDNAVGAHRDVVADGQHTLLAGDQIQGFTQDVSTGGTVDYQLIANMIEFDA